jgi:2-polyprenyl-6-methoxyphenol hydroxylase-like FAD-dependent oxidoreductase
MSISGASQSTIETPVLIVGGGPVGLALAGGLGARGVACLIIEERASGSEEPRAATLDVRTMEFMRRYGLTDRVRDAATPEELQNVLYCTSLSGYEIARLDKPPPSSSGSPERGVRIDQLRLDPILRDFAASHADTRLRFRWRLESLKQRGDCILAEIADLAALNRRTIAAQYVIDCTGSASTIRETNGLRLEGAGPADHYAQIYTRIPGLAHHTEGDETGETMFVDASGIWRTLESIDGRGLYRLLLRGKEHWENADKIDATAALGEIAGRPVVHQVFSTARWQARNAVANRWREGNILLAGDAAHQSRSTSGAGLGLGLADAFDLAWKLEARLAGWATTGIVDSYEAERRSVAKRGADEAEAIDDHEKQERPYEFHSDIARDTPAGRAARKALGTAIDARHAATRPPDGLASAPVYAGSPIVAGDDAKTSGLPALVCRPGVTPGARAPHARMQNGSSTLDLYGKGFVLMRLGQRAPEPGGIDRAFQHRGVPLTYRTIDDPAIMRLHDCRLVLVRPDGHVAWRGDKSPDDPLAVVDRIRGAML